MEKAGLSGEVSDFDYRIYCNGNPVFCFFFRRAEAEKEKKEG
jgi:hypothetical protein